MIKHLVFVFCASFALANLATAQTLTIEECYELARANYPAIKKMNLIAQTGELDLKNANKKFIPQLNFSGQATYQSETVGFADITGPDGTPLPSLSKDQYKLQGEVTQLIYDGGSNKSQKDLIEVNNELEQQSLETDLYAINSRINSIYFSVLLMDAQLKQNKLNEADLRAQVQKTEASYANGVAYKSNVDELKAAIVNVEMAGIEYQSNRNAYLQMLSQFIGKELDQASQLTIPDTRTVDQTINRPELRRFDLQQASFEAQKKDLQSSYLPQVSGFFQAGYGRPTLNIIENKFGPWYLAGVRFSWSLGSLYTNSNKKQSLSNKQQQVSFDRETFLFNTQLNLTQEDENVNKYLNLLQKDDEVIALRESVTESAAAQMENGVITTHEYIQKVNTESIAKQNKILHQIQLLQAKYNQKFITGNY